MRIPQWIGNRNMEKSSAINSGSSGGTGWTPDAASGVQFPALPEIQGRIRPATLERIKLRRNSSVMLQQQYCKYRHRK